MGGAQGHLMHPWEDESLTIVDLCVLFGMAFGQQQANPVFEKYDGINMLFRWDESLSELVFARSLTDMRNGGIRLDAVKTRFKDEPEVGETCHQAMQALTQAFNENVGDGELAMFAQHWGSCEVLSRRHANIIRYDADTIVIHPIWVDDVTGITFNGLREISFETEIDGWRIVPPTYYAFLGRNDALSRAISKTMALPYKLHLPPGLPTLGDIYWYSIRSQAIDAGIPSYILDRVVQRVAKENGHPTLTQLKKDARYDSDVKLIQDFVKDELNVTKRAHAIVESIVREFSVGLMEGIGSELIEDEQAEVRHLRETYAACKNELMGSPHEAFVRTQDARLGSVENINSALEGVIVYHSEKKTFYKFTGWFAPVNQVVGTLRYNR